MFFGSPRPAAICLAELVRSSHEVVGVITKVDRRRSRRGAVSKNPVAELADRHLIPIFYDPSDALGLDFDLGVVVAYGKIIPESVLKYRPLVNVHFSLLPRWRGAAPVERAILAGDTQTGVTIMEVAPELDSGGIYAQRALEIGPGETSLQLTERMAQLGSELLLESLPEIHAGSLRATPQDGEVTWANKLTPDEMRVDWSKSPEYLLALVRVGRPWTTLGSKRILLKELHSVDGEIPKSPQDPPGTLGVALHGGTKVVTVTTGAGQVVLDRVQPEGRGEMDGLSWFNGITKTGGLCLGQDNIG